MYLAFLGILQDSCLDYFQESLQFLLFAPIHRAGHFPAPCKNPRAFHRIQLASGRFLIFRLARQTSRVKARLFLSHPSIPLQATSRRRLHAHAPKASHSLERGLHCRPLPSPKESHQRTPARRKADSRGLPCQKHHRARGYFITFGFSKTLKDEPDSLPCKSALVAPPNIQETKKEGNA